MIGRRFVPRGTLDRQWNLIVRACGACNGVKAELENDLSALTMQPDAVGRHACDDPRLLSEARRRAEGAYSWRTRRKVKDSAEQVALTVPFLMPGATATFTFVSSPQTDQDRVFCLAWAHIQGFFYLITYEQDAHRGTRRGGFLPGEFRPLTDARRADWGNALLRGFVDATATWYPRLHVIGANWFFKVCIRRHPEGAEIWSWTLEWNASHRTAGFFGDPDAVRVAEQGLPPLQLKILAETPDACWSSRVEKPLRGEEDRLFTAPTGHVA